MSTLATTPRPVVRVEELRRAWLAVQAGQFSSSSPPTLAPAAGTDTATWDPHEPVLPVVGCIGGAGSTTLAVAIAHRGGPARVVECCTVTASGLAAAATEELGQDEQWSHGRREGRVILERSAAIRLRPDDVPLPPPPRAAVDLTVLDIGWELGQVLGAPSWLGDQLLHTPTAVAVTTATVPGLRRLEGVLALLENTDVVAAVVGPRRKKWPRGVEASMGHLTHLLDDGGRLVEVSIDKTLAARGVDRTPLPAAVLRAAGDLLRLTVAGTTEKGTEA